MMDDKQIDYGNGDGNGDTTYDSQPEAETTRGDSSKVTFIAHIDDDAARIELVLEKGFYIGLTRDELTVFERDPKWKRFRIALFVLSVIGWLSLLGAAIYTACTMPGCPPRPLLGWPERSIIYEINVPSFRVGSSCDYPRKWGNVNGIYDILNMPSIDHPSSRNYFLNTLYPVNALWLRGLHAMPPYEGTYEGEFDVDTVGANRRYLMELFTLARKKKRLILLDLLPYEWSNKSISIFDLNCTFLYGLAKTQERIENLTNPEVKIRCFTEEEMTTRLMAFIQEHVKYANGFVLDYSPWFVRTESGKKALRDIVATVHKYDGSMADYSFKDFEKKYVFFRMPIIDSAFNTSLIQRMKDEAVAKEAGVRVIVETIDMISDNSYSCVNSRCLVSLINEIQKPRLLNDSGNLLGVAINKTQIGLSDIPHRAFTIDDPLLKRRALPSQENADRRWTAESLVAFISVGLPGSPIVYYGSEIGMSHQSPKTQMKWRDENTCYSRADEPYCFCSTLCSFDDSKLGTCPNPSEEFPPFENYPINSDKDYPPSVSEQVRIESTGPLKTITSFLKAKGESDSLIWGKANATVLPSSGGHSPLSVVRSANDRFTEYALIVAFGAKGGSFPAEQMSKKCYEEVVFHNKPKDTKSSQGRFDQMVVQAREVRLVKIVHCSSCQSVTASFYTLLACCFFAVRFHWNFF